MTIIANESYADFTKALQKEIESETGVTFGKEQVGNARERATANAKIKCGQEHFAALPEHVEFRVLANAREV